MSGRPLVRALAVALLLAAQVIGASGIARADSPKPAPSADPYANTQWDGKTHLNFTPYLWLPTLNATLRFRGQDVSTGAPITGGPGSGGTFDTQIGPSNYLAKINFALMGTIELRKGNWAIFSDAINTNIAGSTGQTINVTGPLNNVALSISGKAGMQTVATLWTVGPSYTVYHDKDSAINLLAGGRFTFLSANANFQIQGNGPLGLTYSAGAARKENYGDAVLGTYGQFGLGGHWSVPFYADLGTGTPAFTWQAFLGLKYGNALIGWRNLAYSSGGSSNLLQSMSLGGPMLGYSLHF